MLGRSCFVLHGLLALGCAPSQDPLPAHPPDHPQHFVDADADVAEPSAPPAIAPDTVDLEINAPYDEQTDPGQWATRFEREGREVFDHRMEILGELGLRPGLDVADVGAGTGLFTLELARAVGDEGTVYAIDVQAYFLDHIGQKAKKAGLSNVKLVRAQQDAMGLDTESIDLALMSDVYHHIERPAPYLASVHAALRPGGRLVVIDYRREEGKSSAWMLEHIRASAEEFRAEIESAGFRLLKSHEGVLEENFFFEFERREKLRSKR